MERNNSKQIVLSVLAVVVLVIAVVGVSFAMYTFSGTGTKENVITTGTLSIAFDGTKEHLMSATGRLPESDAKGLQEAEYFGFNVKATMAGTATLNYSLYFVPVEGATLTANYIKFYVTDAAGKGLAGFGTCSSGETTEAACNGDWTAQPKMMRTAGGTTYVYGETAVTPFAAGTFTQTGNVDYKIQAWIDNSYDLPGGGAEVAAVGTCSVNPETNNTAAACHTAGGTWTLTKGTNTETFSFTVKLVANQEAVAA